MCYDKGVLTSMVCYDKGVLSSMLCYNKGVLSSIVRYCVILYVYAAKSGSGEMPECSTKVVLSAAPDFN